MSTPPRNPISLRYPFELKDQPPEVVQAHRYAFQGIVDLNQAIVALKGQINAKTVTTVTNIRTGGGGGGTPAPPAPFPFPGLGAIRDETGVTSYTILAADNGILLILNNASPVAVTLDSAMVTPYFIFATNYGTGTVTFTPTTGAINGSSSWVIQEGGLFLIAFDGTNWKTSDLIELILLQTGGVNNGSQVKLNLVAGANVTLADDGVGDITISSTGGTTSPFTPRLRTTAYTAVANDAVFCNTTSAGFTVTLPAAASNSGATIIVKKTSSDANTLTVGRTGADLIDGATSQSTTIPFSSFTFVSDGVSNWGVF